MIGMSSAENPSLPPRVARNASSKMLRNPAECELAASPLLSLCRSSICLDGSACANG